MSRGDIAVELYRQEMREWLQAGGKGQPPQQISAERVRQIEVRAMNKLKAALSPYKDYLAEDAEVMDYCEGVRLNSSWDLVTKP